MCDLQMSEVKTCGNETEQKEKRLEFPKPMDSCYDIAQRLGKTRDRGRRSTAEMLA